MSKADAVVAVLDEVRAQHATDPRVVVFDVSAERHGSTITLQGCATAAEAVAEAAHRLSALAGVTGVTDEVRRLPDAALGTRTSALVRAAVAPVCAEARLSAGLASQYVLGHRLELLEQRGAWWRARGEDGYIGWIHGGYLEVGELAWAQAWERGEAGESMVSLGAALEDEAGHVFARLPWGARVVADTPSRLRLPDGRRGTLSGGEVVAVDRLTDRFPARGESLMRTARRWLGAPYLWGGVTPAGTDCSGFVQSVFWMHGLALPRDSDQQARVGAALEPGEDLGELRAGDLLFFSDDGDRVSHVALSLGGPHVLHAAVANGGVDVNDLSGDLELEQRLRGRIVTCRRVLPDL